MPYKFQKILILILISLPLSLPIHSQEMRRWLRVPFSGVPAITRHELQKSDQAGRVFLNRYEKTPGSALMKMIRKNFPELWPNIKVKDDSIDTSKSTLLLESLQIEADEFKRNATATLATDNASTTGSLF
jgi:hypothetical protein